MTLRLIILVSLCFISLSTQSQSIVSFSIEVTNDTTIILTQEAIGQIPEGGVQRNQVFRNFKSKSDVEIIVKKQLEIVDSEIERYFKLRKDLIIILDKLKPVQGTPNVKPQVQPKKE